MGFNGFEFVLEGLGGGRWVEFLKGYASARLHWKSFLLAAFYKGRGGRGEQQQLAKQNAVN